MPGKEEKTSSCSVLLTGSEQQPPTIIPQRDLLFEVLTSKVVLALGALLALVSFIVAIRNSILNSMDFQWSGAHLLLLHRDPWAVYQAGNLQHQILLSQVPNYLHELYVLLLPLALLPFDKAKLIWAACNITFVFILGLSIARLYELDKRKTWLLFILVLTSTPLRVTIGNGQSDALALACVGLWAVVSTQRGRGLLLGVAYEKYSFPPVLVVFLLLRKRWKLFFYSLLPPLLGFLFVDAWLGTRGKTLALEPFHTATHNNSVTLGWANIMAVVGQIFANVSHPPMWMATLPYICAIFLACAIAAYFATRGSEVDSRILLACLLTAPLACFPHQIYDFLALIFSLAIALKSSPSRTRNVSLLLISYFWYLERVLGIRRWETRLFTILPSFLLLLALIAATYQLWKTTKWSSDWEI